MSGHKIIKGLEEAVEYAKDDSKLLHLKEEIKQIIFAWDQGNLSGEDAMYMIQELIIDTVVEQNK